MVSNRKNPAERTQPGGADVYDYDMRELSEIGSGQFDVRAAELRRIADICLQEGRTTRRCSTDSQYHATDGNQKAAWLYTMDRTDSRGRSRHPRPTYKCMTPAICNAGFQQAEPGNQLILLPKRWENPMSDTAADRVAALRVFHSIDLGAGIVTPEPDAHRATEEQAAIYLRGYAWQAS